MNPNLERLREVIDTAIDGMTADDLTRHPEGKWCAAEVLEHLSLTYLGSTRGFQKCLQAGHPLTTSLTLKQRLGIVLVTKFGYFPTGREAPEMTRPKGSPAEDVAREIGPKIEAMDKAIAECEARFGKRKRLLDHPVLGPLTADQWRKFHLIHAQHHMKQISRLRNQPHGRSEPS